MTAGRKPIGEKVMTNAERKRRWREKHPQGEAAPRQPAPAKARRVVGSRYHILVPLPAKGERIYFDEDGREIDEPPPAPGRTYIDDRGRIVEEVTGATDEEVARMYGITGEEWRRRHPPMRS